VKNVKLLLIVCTTLLTSCAGFPKGEICIVDGKKMLCRSPKVTGVYERPISGAQNYLCTSTKYVSDIRKWGRKHCK
jgi:hypothetical protein